MVICMDFSLRLSQVFSTSHLSQTFSVLAAHLTLHVQQTLDNSAATHAPHGGKDGRRLISLTTCCDFLSLVALWPAILRFAAVILQLRPAGWRFGEFCAAPIGAFFSCNSCVHGFWCETSSTVSKVLCDWKVLFNTQKKSR